MNLGLKRRRAIITGGTRGIGRAIAETLATEGADVAICARNATDVARTVAALKKKGVRAMGDAIDVADGPVYKAWLEKTARALGGVDIFIPNVSAGAATEGEAPWIANFNVDLMHTVRGVEILLPHLAAARQGAIVIIGTIAAVETFIAPTSYGAIKAALITYAKQLSQAVAPQGVRVNVVSPGPVYFEGGDWARMKEQAPDFFNETEKQCVLGRMAAPEDVANAVAFLAGPAAGMITGVNLVVDGGFTKRVQL